MRELTEEQIKKIKDELKNVRELSESYFKKYAYSFEERHKEISDDYLNQETGICKVLDILGIDY